MGVLDDIKSGFAEAQRKMKEQNNKSKDSITINVVMRHYSWDKSIIGNIIATILCFGICLFIIYYAIKNVSFDSISFDGSTFMGLLFISIPFLICAGGIGNIIAYYKFKSKVKQGKIYLYKTTPSVDFVDDYRYDEKGKRVRHHEVVTFPNTKFKVECKDGSEYKQYGVNFVDREPVYMVKLKKNGKPKAFIPIEDYTYQPEYLKCIEYIEDSFEFGEDDDSDMEDEI